MDKFGISGKVTACARATRQAMTFVVPHCLDVTLVCIVCGFALLGCNSTLDARQVAAHEQCWYHMTQLLRLDSSQVVRRRTLATLGDIAALRHVSGRAAPAHSVTFAQKQNFAPRAPNDGMPYGLGGWRTEVSRLDDTCLFGLHKQTSGAVQGAVQQTAYLL